MTSVLNFKNNTKLRNFLISIIGGIIVLGGFFSIILYFIRPQVTVQENKIPASFIGGDIKASSQVDGYDIEIVDKDKILATLHAWNIFGKNPALDHYSLANSGITNVEFILVDKKQELLTFDDGKGVSTSTNGRVDGGSNLKILVYLSNDGLKKYPAFFEKQALKTVYLMRYYEPAINNEDNKVTLERLVSKFDKFFDDRVASEGLYFKITRN